MLFRSALNSGPLSGSVVELGASGGGITQAAAAVLQAGTLRGTAGATGSVALAGTANSIASLASFAVASGDFALKDAASLSIVGPVGAKNIAISAPTIVSSGSVVATTSATLSAGAGGIALNSGAVLSGVTVDLSATGNGVAQATDATLVASTLLSGSGIGGTVNLVGTANTVAILGTVAVRSEEHTSELQSH